MKQKVYKSPRISINKLAEYMSCSPARRRTILTNAKYPPEFIVSRYNPFYETATRYFASNPLDEALVSRAITALGNQTPKNDWERDNVTINIEALDALHALADDLRIDSRVLKVAPETDSLLTLARVAVSIRPELTVMRASELGAIKLVVSKTEPVTQRQADYIGTATRLFLLQKHGKNAAVVPELCLTVDVFANRIFAAPKAFKRRQADLEAACEEIAARWPTLQSTPGR